MKTILEFGAVGNGINDDTLSFKKAIECCDIVYVPNGIYKISNISLHSGTKLIGEDVYRTVILDSESPEGVFVDGSKCCVSIVDKSNSRIENITIQGSSAINNKIGLCLHAAKGAVVKNVIIDSFSGRGLFLQHKNTNGCVFTDLKISNITKTTDNIYGIGIWIYGGGSGGACWGAPNNCIFNNITVDSCDDTGVAIDSGTQSGTGNPPFLINFSRLNICNCALSHGSAALGFTGCNLCSVNDAVISCDREKAVGPAIFFGLDNSKIDTTYCTVSNVVIYNAIKPVANDKTKGTNLVNNAVVYSVNGKQCRISSQKY